MAPKSSLGRRTQSVGGRSGRLERWRRDTRGKRGYDGKGGREWRRGVRGGTKPYGPDPPTPHNHTTSPGRIGKSDEPLTSIPSTSPYRSQRPFFQMLISLIPSS